MTITISAIENAAPDQASLKAATKLLSPAKWPERVISTDGALIWGACQGSGANPYRVVVDTSDLGAKCSCPSRKFPCKHALALMMQYAEGQADFSPADVPEWITDWLGRRRKTTTAETTDGPKKSLAAARLAEEEKPDDPKAEARREAARVKRAEATRNAIADGLAEMEGWIADQLRTGLSDTLNDLNARCRRIASRLVDAKAGSLAARIDGIPARVLALPQRERADALISELGKLVLVARAWGDGTAPMPGVQREISGAEPRDTLLANAEAPRHTGAWEVLATREENRRDGLIGRSTWLLGLDPDGPRFALLQDFFQASGARQGAGFTAGDQFRAELVFYPSAVPLRAHIVEHIPAESRTAWPASAAGTDILADFTASQTAEPWLLELPLLLPEGRLAEAADTLWWTTGPAALPLTEGAFSRVVQGTRIHTAAILWNGHRGHLLAADTSLGRFHADI